jgi:hypothetical protein
MLLKIIGNQVYFQLQQFAHLFMHISLFNQAKNIPYSQMFDRFSNQIL